MKTKNQRRKCKYHNCHKFATHFSPALDVDKTCDEHYKHAITFLAASEDGRRYLDYNRIKY